MTSKNYNKYKYNLIENAMYKKFRILNSGKFMRVKNNDNNTNNKVKSNNYQYFPIESDKSKMDGHTIYLVTQEEDTQKENDKYENLYTEPKENFYNIKTKKILIDNNNLIGQRVNDFSIFRNFNYPLNWRSFRINKKQIHISDNIVYDFNKPFNEIEKNKLIDNGVNTDDNNNSNFFNIIKAKQTNNYENENNENNNSNKISTYRKKLTSNQYNQKIDNSQQISYIPNINKTSKLINNLYELQKNRNEGKIINIHTENNYENKSINLEESRKNPISKNSSLNEYLNVGTMQNMTLLNRSLDEDSQQNKSLLYQPLNSNFLDNINDSNILGKKFLDGIKNQQRKISLLQAMARYNRFKFRGKFNIKKNNNKIINEENKDKDKNKGEEIISIKADIKSNENYDNNNEENNNIINNNDKNKEEKFQENNDDNEQNENENEFSFNSELRKNDKKNHLKEINIANDVDNEKENEKSNYEKENEEANLEEPINDNINNKIIDIKNEIENSEENKEITKKEIENDINNNSNIIENNNDVKEEEPANESMNNKIEIKEEEMVEEKVEEKILKNKENDKEKSIKPEINISIDNKESPHSEKKIPEINISIDHNDINIQKEKESSKKDSNNNSNNNIINNSINININNNDSSNNKNDLGEQNKYIQINNIKQKNNLKPGYFIRKVVREEHYYVDENGKEKILQVKQEYINNEDKKKMKVKHPHKKRYINMGNRLNNLNNALNKNNQTGKIEQIKSIKMENINNIFEDKNNLIESSSKNDNNDMECFSSRMTEKNDENINIEQKKELNDPLINDNLSSASGPVLYPKYINYNYFNKNENDNHDNFNINKENKNIKKELKNNRNVVDITNKHAQVNAQKKENPYSSIAINRSKNLETKTHEIRRQEKKDYGNNTFKLSSSSNIKTLTKEINNDSNKKENKNNINIKTISDNNYIKVNKMDKYRNTKNDIYHKLSLNTYSLYNNANIKIGKKRRESSKNHTYHEINLTTSKNDNKLTNKSLMNYLNEGNDELNTSINSNKISVNSNNFNRYSVNTYTISDRNNNENIKNSTRYHRNRNKKELNSSMNKDNHRYFESKSIKKDRNTYNIHNDYTRTKNNDDSVNKEYRSKNIEHINKKNTGYFYSEYNVNNNNNSQTAKKRIKTTTYYH